MKKNMDIRPLRNEADYEWALKEVERYFDKEPKRGSRDGDRFEVLTALVVAYEEKHWPIDPPDPIDAIRYRMEISGYSQSDLGRLLGSRSRASSRARHRSCWRSWCCSESF